MRRFALGLVLAAGIAVPAQAAAATLTVNAFLDTQSDGVCDADCTVRDAVTAADGQDTVLVPPGTHTISLPGAGEDANASGDLDADSDNDPLALRGTGSNPSAVVIDATGLGDRVFDLSGGGEFLITNLTITGGSAADGGAIRNAGPEVTLSEVVLDGNQAPSSGGAVLNGTAATTGTRMTILNSVLSDNRVLAGDGGAIRNQDDGRLVIVGSTLSGNRAEGVNGDGGAIFNEDQASLAIATSRLEQNEAFADDFVGGGGAIFTQNGSSATVTASVIADNRSGNAGGGVNANNDTSLTVVDSVLSDNVALGTDTRGGGGIFGGNDSVVTILRSTLSGNSAAAGGGGVMRQNDGVLEIVNSTLSANTTPLEGGAIHADSAVFGYTRVAHSTIAGNNAGTAGGGIFNGTSTDLFEPLLVTGTIVSGNHASAAPQNCADDIAATPLVSRGFNLDSGTTCGFAGPGDINGRARVGPLADNGGPTKTHALKRGSDAIGRGKNSTCPSTDQRGVRRPQGRRCDIGAYERRRG